MALPYFFLHAYQGEELIQLDEANSRHMIAVLRMEPGEELLLTDGKGLILQASIVDAHKKKATVRVTDRKNAEARRGSVTIAISPVKNTSRFEWFLEKATEIGVRRIIPILTERTEKQNFRYDRMQQILISAVLQSQQAWLPELGQPIRLTEVLTTATSANKWIAHCVETERESLRKLAKPGEDHILLIGPEGDFSMAEIEAALAAGFRPVTLGDTRLRTETAGLVGAALLCVS
jgi:16S rRNA (uracil1498-N3)-methyltransferase